MARAGALGDTLLALPALAVLRRAVGPEGAVELLGRRPAADLTRGASLASRVHDFDRALFRAFFDEGVDASALEAFLEPFDLVVAYARLPRLRELAARLDILAVETEPLPPRGVHASDHLLDALAPLGLARGKALPELELGAGALEAASRFLEAHGLGHGAFAALHPGSGSPRKNWPPVRFRELAALARQSGRRVLWIEGEADARAVAEARGADANEPVARALELPVLAAVLARAGVYIGNDSGVSHLAAATGAPTLAVFGPTDPVRWAPRGRRAAVVGWRRLPAEAWAFALDRMRSR